MHVSPGHRGQPWLPHHSWCSRPFQSCPPFLLPRQQEVDDQPQSAGEHGGDDAAQSEGGASRRAVQLRRADPHRGGGVRTRRSGGPCRTRMLSASTLAALASALATAAAFLASALAAFTSSLVGAIPRAARLALSNCGGGGGGDGVFTRPRFLGERDCSRPGTRRCTSPQVSRECHVGPLGLLVVLAGWYLLLLRSRRSRRLEVAPSRLAGPHPQARNGDSSAPEKASWASSALLRPLSASATCRVEGVGSDTHMTRFPYVRAGTGIAEPDPRSPQAHRDAPVWPRGGRIGAAAPGPHAAVPRRTGNSCDPETRTSSRDPPPPRKPW